jgi:hypothetical protein
MRSRSGDKCLADKYPPWSIFGPNMFKHSLYGNVETDLIMKTWPKYNKVDHENEVKVFSVWFVEQLHFNLDVKEKMIMFMI